MTIAVSAGQAALMAPRPAVLDRNIGENFG
jgi:hypothetical protein